MKIGILNEVKKGERRVAITPSIVKSLIDKGFEFIVEKDAGLSAQFKNSDYKEAGAEVKKKQGDL